MNNLPNHVLDKIILFCSHPVADLVKSSRVFQYNKFYLESTHGCPFDRRCSDAYYYRDPNPHYWTNGNGRDGGTVYDLTVEQEFAYELGYLGTKIRKNGDDLASLHSLLSTY